MHVLKALAPETWNDFCGFVDATECTRCNCMYWHFDGDNDAWQVAVEGGELRARKRALVERGATSGFLLYTQAAVGPGIVGRAKHRTDQTDPTDPFHGSPNAPPPDPRALIPVAWCQVARRETLPKLVARRDLASLPGPAGLVSITCFLVRPDVRRRGVAREMLRRVLATLAADGVPEVEAYPHAGEHEANDVWQGPLRLFEKEGFNVIRADPDRPVVRKRLSAAR